MARRNPLTILGGQGVNTKASDASVRETFIHYNPRNVANHPSRTILLLATTAFRGNAVAEPIATCSYYWPGDQREAPSVPLLQLITDFADFLLLSITFKKESSYNVLTEWLACCGAAACAPLRL